MKWFAMFSCVLGAALALSGEELGVAESTAIAIDMRASRPVAPNATLPVEYSPNYVSPNEDLRVRVLINGVTWVESEEAGKKNFTFGEAGVYQFTLQVVTNESVESEMIAFCAVANAGAVAIQDSWIELPTEMFEHCDWLTALSIPSSVTNIAPTTFGGCMNLMRVDVPSLKDWLGIKFKNAAANPLSTGAKLYVGGEDVTELMIPEGVTEIGEYAFQGGAFTFVLIPSSVTNVSSTAFAGCLSIMEVDIGCPGTSASKTKGILHRWSFNGDLADSAGGQTAKIVGNVNSDDQQYTLEGGSRGCSYIDLGSNILPTDGGGATFEIWGTQRSVKKCSRIWDIGGGTSTDMLMAWTSKSDVNSDGICIRQIGDDMASMLAPYALGVEFHIVTVFQPQKDGSWKVCYYKQDATTGETLAATTIDTAGKAWSLATQSQNDCWLGHSHWTGDYDANASYNEVRVWDCALSEAELSENARIGPNKLPAISNLRTIFPDSYAKIRKITVADGVTHLSKRMFDGCSDLAVVVLPVGLVEVDENVFCGCASLKRVDVPSIKDWLGIKFGNAAANPLSNGAKLYVDGMEVTELVIPEDVSEIGEYAFQGGHFASVSIPPNVTNIALTAFAGCSSIVDVSAFDSMCAEASGVRETMPTVSGDWRQESEGVYRSKAIGDNKSSQMRMAVKLNEPCTYVFQWRVSSDPYDYLSYNVDGNGQSGKIGGSVDWQSVSIPLSAGTHTIVWLYSKDNGFSAGSDCGWVKLGTISTKLCAISLFDIFPDSVSGVDRATIGSIDGIINANFLSGCESLKALEISDDVKRIDAGAFDDCTALESVVFPAELEDFGLDLIPEAMRGSLGYDADGFMVKDGWLLDYKNKGASELVVPEGVVGIGHYALAYMEDLELVSLPSTLKYIASAAFVEDTYLDNLEIPDSVVYIGKGAFEDCSWIQTMTIGTGVKEIADRAFAGCSYLGVVTLPFGLESIGDEAFADCRKMPSVSIPVSVRHVASSAFAGCSALTGVMTPTSVAPLSGWFKPVYTQIRDVTVPAGETDICCNMFKGCSALVSVFMPEGVTNIADGAFMDCVNLSVVELPSTLRSIGADAFRNCDALTAVGLPDAVERIGVRTFYDCAKLKDVSLSESLGELPDQVFDSCSVLDSVVVQAAVSNLGARAFGSAMTAVYYLGDAPSYDELVYAATPSRLITYVKDGSRGWDGIPQSRNLPRNWPVGNASARSITTWSPVRYDVVFDAGDGLFVSPVPARTYACEQTVGTVYSLPPYNPVRQGWKFDGWWTEISGGTRITPSTRVVLTKAHTLYAHWTQGYLVKVRFNANGGTVNPAEADYVAEVPYGEFPLPTREHFVFDGWFTEPQGGSVVRISMEAPKADRELFAHWSPAHYYIRFNANNGTRAFEMQDFTYGQTVTLRPNRFVCPSCTFAGWSLVPGGEAVYADRKTIENLAAVEDGVIDLYAAWSGDNYAVRFDSNGGQGRMENQTFVVGVSQPLLACSYMRNGYEFLGWAQSPSGQIRFRDGEEVEGLSSRQGEIVELFAVWGIAGMKTTVSFDPNGGTVGTTSVDCAPGEPFGELPVPVREGWAFVGWLDAGGVLVTSESIVPPGVVKLTASWGGGVRIVLWFKDGCRRMTFAAGHSFGRLPVLPPAQAPRPRYRFRGWAYDIAGMRLVSPTDTVPEEDLELYAVWVPEEDAEGDEPLVDYDEAGLVIWDGWLLGCEDKSAVAIAVPEGVVGIGQGALANMYDLQTVSLPSTLQVIAAGAFAYDTALDGVKIPDGVEIIGEDAFAHCTYLQTLTLGRGVKHVALGAFRDCAQLANAIFRDGLESVGAEVFASCWRMQSVSLPLSVTNVGETAFDDCESLTGVTVPTGVAPLSQWFKPIYKQIRDVTVPVGETEVCANMFKGCSALVSASLPEGVTNLADGAFWDCTSLPSVVLPSSLVALGADVFRNCDAMTAAGVPEGVERIGVRAFYDCYRLQDVALSAKLTELPDQVFDSCAALDSFVVPVAVTNLGARIFGNRLSAVYFVGNAPHYDDNVYASTKSGLITYVKNGTKGWEGRDKPTSRALPDTWPVENSYTRTLTTWEPVQYDVTFDAGEGLFPSVQTATYACRQTVGTAYALPPFNPTFKAHKFAGWWTAPVGGTQVTPSTGVKLQKEHTLYAHWAEGIVVAVRFNACGGTVDTEEQNYTAEVPFGSFPVPTREHYEFVGWFTERIGGELMKASTEVPMADCELFAHWTPRQYKIRFNANNGSGSVAYQDYVYGQTVTLHGNVFGCTGCQFAGWSLTPGGVAVYGDCATLQEAAALQDGVFDLYAVWAGNVYVVRFDSHGGVGEMANQTFVIGVSMPLAHCAFTRNGYIFRGWSRLTTGSAAYGDMETVSDLTKVPNSAVTLFAVWERDPDAEWAFEDYLNCTNLTFTLGGDSPYWYGLKTSRADVAGMMQSGAIGDMQTNWIQTVVSGSGTIGFWWKASGEFEKSKKGVITRYDYAEFSIDGVSVEEIGDESDWTYVTIPVEGSGSHVLRWMYHKDESGSDGDDCAWLSEVSWEPTQVAEPIPELPENPTADDVQSALAGSADSQLLVHVTDAATYNAYREWALKIGAAEVKASPNAWVSFAVDSAALLEKVPTDEDLTIEEFKPTAAAGAFEFTVSVKDVAIGSDAVAENLKTIFGLAGTPSLGSSAFDPKNVTIEFGEPKDGKLKFTAKPNTGDSQALPASFFMKMKVR